MSRMWIGYLVEPINSLFVPLQSFVEFHFSMEFSFCMKADNWKLVFIRNRQLLSSNDFFRERLIMKSVNVILRRRTSSDVSDYGYHLK